MTVRPGGGNGVAAGIDEFGNRALARGQVGVMIGALTGGRHSIRGFGRARSDEADGLPPDAVTLFEIGSITKLFTALLLADLAAEGLVGLDDPLQSHLPEGVTAPPATPPITLAELGSHTAGLPRDARGTTRAVLRRPLHPYEALLESFATLTVDDLNASLARTRVRRKPGRARYSNLGAGLLGNALAFRAGLPYGELVRTRICRPLRMEETHVDVPEQARPRLAQGHTRRGRPRPPFEDPALLGAGALRSTPSDMLRFLEAAIEPPPGGLGAAMELAQRERARMGRRIGVGLGWLSVPLRGRPHRVWWHNGGTGGFRSFVGLVREAATAVVVLGNANRSVDVLGLHVLEALNPKAGKDF